jgi:glycosyltransferase involved in cell wall biosynthesis
VTTTESAPAVAFPVAPEKTQVRATAIVSLVIPALNEAENIPGVMASLPVAPLRAAGYEVEVIVVDNNSTDDTGAVARAHGAQVVLELERGYGNAYKAGFRAARGDIIATGDADLTYPMEVIPELVRTLEQQDLDFISGDRLSILNGEAMTASHIVGNWALSLFSKMLFGSPYRDSQSGMWVFRRSVWESCEVTSGGMGFSQEIKNEAFLRGFRCAEVPIEYRVRGGAKKLRTLRDGSRNARELLEHRLRRLRVAAPRLQQSEIVIDLRDSVSAVNPLEA